MFKTWQLFFLCCFSVAFLSNYLWRCVKRFGITVHRYEKEGNSFLSPSDINTRKSLQVNTSFLFCPLNGYNLLFSKKNTFSYCEISINIFQSVSQEALSYIAFNTL